MVEILRLRKMEHCILCSDVVGGGAHDAPKTLIEIVNCQFSNISFARGVSTAPGAGC